MATIPGLPNVIPSRERSLTRENRWRKARSPSSPWTRTTQRDANGFIQDGNYTLRPPLPGDGALPGKYGVHITSKEVDNTKVIETIQAKGGGGRQHEIAKAASKAKNLVPAKYQLPETSKLEAIVKEEKNSSTLSSRIEASRRDDLESLPLEGVDGRGLRGFSQGATRSGPIPRLVLSRSSEPPHEGVLRALHDLDQTTTISGRSAHPRATSAGHQPRTRPGRCIS